MHTNNTFSAALDGEQRKMSRKTKETRTGALASISSLANKQGAQPVESAILCAIEKLKEELLAKIEKKAESQNARIDQLRRDLQQATEATKAENATLGKQVSSLETARSVHSDSITQLENDMVGIKKQIDILTACNEDLEAHSRRCNLRVTGIKEGRENGMRPVEFMTLVLDRAHRLLRWGQEDGLPLRAWIIRCHYF